MVSKRIGIYSAVACATLTSVAIVGCGGSSSTGGTLPIVHTTGGFQVSSGTSSSGVTAQSTPQQVQVTLSDGSSQTVTVPANGTIPPGGSATVLAPGVPILNGLGLAPKAVKVKGAPTTSNFVQGEIDFDGCDTGVTVTAQGTLSGYLALTPSNADVASGLGYHTISVVGPFTVTDAASGARLDIEGNMTFNIAVMTNASLGTGVYVASVPTTINGQLPSNSGYLDGSNHVTCVYPAVWANYGGNAFLQIASTSWTVQQARVLGTATSSVEFQAFSNSHQVPATGITNLDFAYPKVVTN